MPRTDAVHADEIARLRTHASSDHLSPLETKAVLTAVELLEGHAQGKVRLCELPHVQSLVSLCLGEPFVVHAGEACGCDGSDRR